ncbi:MAG: leucine-rich repeat protein [Clostridia bacterium]|nr:leucine-rich repeat protein [Clostridia bacterium]
MKNLKENSKDKGGGVATGGLSKKGLILLISLIAAVLAVTAVIVGIAVFGRGEDTPPDTNTYAEAGIYYTPSGKECEITLVRGGSFTMLYSGNAYTGSYTLDGGLLSLNFTAESVKDATASYENEIITLTWEGATVRLVRKVDYTVKFDTVGGSELPSASVTNGQSAVKPSDPTKENYIFVGWYSDAAYTRPFTFSADVITADTTLYARWTEDTGAREYTLSFDLNYVGAEQITAASTRGGRLFNAPAPQREGYTFGGWWVSTAGEAERLSYKISEDTVFTSDTTLFAVWRAEGSTGIEAPSLQLNAAGISWARVDGARSYDVTVTDSEGAVLLSRTVNTASASIPFSDYIAGIYTVTVVANSNTGAEDNSVSYYTVVNKGLDKVGGIIVSDGSVLVFEGVENAEKYLITVSCGNKAHNHTNFDNGSSKTFSFVNCPMAEDGIRFTVTAVADGYLSSVSDEFVYKRELSAVEGVEWDAEDSLLTWIPVADAEYYLVTVGCANGAHSHAQPIRTAAPSLDLKECIGLNGKITVEIKAVADGYISAPATEAELLKSALSTPSSLTVIGTVVRWDAVEGASGYEISVNGEIYSTSDCSLDIAAVIDTSAAELYEISLHAIGEQSSSWSNPVKCYTDSSTPEYSNGVLYWQHVLGADYYEIQVNGGEISKAVGVSYAKITLDVAGENTVRLRFVKGESPSDWVSVTVTAYTVTFDTLGGGAVEKQYKAAGDEITLPATERLGYVFVSWYGVPGGPSANGREILSPFTVGGDATLYAHYNPEKYEIVYNYGLGGTGEELFATVEYERDYTLTVPTSNDVTISFAGWFSAPYGKGTQYTDASGESLIPWSIVGGAEVYAFWIDETIDFTPIKVNGTDAYSVSAGPRINLVSELTVPAYHNGLPVKMLDGNAFSGCKSLKVLNLPATVEVISSLDPFVSCTSLEQINVYAVTEVGNPRYSSLDGVLFENAADGKILIKMPAGRVGGYVIPAETSEIFEGAFMGSALNSVTVSRGVRKIGNDAFANALALRTLLFETADNAAELVIGKRAFSGCTALTDILLPAHLTSIELSKYCVNEKGEFTQSLDYAFVGCTSLDTLTVAAGSSTYRVIDGMLYSADGSQLIYCPTAREGALSITLGTQSVAAGAFVGCDGLTEIIIPNTVTYIGEYAFGGISAQRVTFLGNGFSSVTVGDRAFAYCTELSELVICEGSQLSVIGEGAFLGCTSLSSFEITPSVTSIRDNAFYGCTGLKAVTFAGGSKPLEFGANVFYGCTALTTVEIPANVSKIPGIFGGCSSLTEVRVDESNPYFKSIDGVVFSADESEIVYYPQGRGGEYTVPDTVTVIAAGVFSGNKLLTSLKIPNSVSYIGAEAFKNSAIGIIVFEGDVCAEELVIAESAFQNAALKGYDFVLPAHTKKIEAHAFDGVSYQKIVLPEGLEIIGDYAFFGPSNVGGAVLEIPTTVVSIGEYAFSGMDYKDYGIPSPRYFNVSFKAGNQSLLSIGDYAFYQNTAITVMNLPQSVRSIGNYAFYECSSLAYLYLPASLESIGAFAFAASSYTYMVPITELVIPKGVGYVGAAAFKNCQLLTSVRFEGESDSPDLVLGSAYQRRYEEDGIAMVAVERGGVFASCTRLTEVILSENIVELGEYCFAESGDIGFKVTVNSDSRLATVGDFCFYKSRLESFTVPASVRNLPPVEEFGVLRDRLGIGMYAFAATAGKLTEFTFEKGGEDYPLTIGYRAFEKQIRLEAIELPARLSTYVSASGEVIQPLADGALVFYGASALATVTVEEGCPYTVEGGVLYTADMRELVFCPMAYSGDVTVAQSVTVIHGYAFFYCSEVSSVTFVGKSNLSAIGECAFEGCTAIKSIIIPSGVASIGERAFNNATSLESITIPKALTVLDIAVLDGCTSLKSVLVEQGNQGFSSDGGVLYNLNKTELMLYPMGRTDTEYSVKDGVILIGERAFAGNSTLKAVIFPSSLCEIGENAFFGCTALEAVSIPVSVEIIGDNAFYGASSLANLTFDLGGEKQLVIGNSAFFGAGVGGVTLPARLAYVGIDAFRNSSLERLDFEPSENNLLTEIGGGAFAGTIVTSVSLPKGLTVIGDGAFLGASALESVVFPEGLEAIGKEAFKSTPVREVVLPSSLKKLGASAFYGCVYLERVGFVGGSQLEAIEAGTFYGCTSLVGFTVPTLVREIGGAKNSGAFEGCTSLSQIAFESGDYLTVIGDYAFFGCTSLSEISIPMSVGTLGNYAFSGCTAITEITLHRSTVKLGDGLFLGCTSLSSVEMDTGAGRLGASMFEGCSSLTSIHIPYGVNEIGDRCFYGTAIESFDVAKENKSFVSVSGIIYNSSKTQIAYFPPRLNVQTLVIPKEIVEISAYNFQDCTTIKEIIFEEGGVSPLTIGNHAFDGCYQLRCVILPERLIAIGDWAFKKCNALTSITIPKNVKSIGQYAFNECYKLYEVYNESSIENLVKIGLVNTSVDAVNNNALVGAKVNIYTPESGSSVLFREGDFLFATVNGKKRLIGYEGTDGEITFPEGTYEIAPYLFMNDSSVTRVVVPSTVDMSGTSVFAGCVNLSAIYVSGGEIPSSWESGWNNKHLAFGNYTGESITYSFVTGTDGEIDSVSSVDAIELPTAYRDGHIFMGWYADAELSGEALPALYYSSEQNVLYASFLTEDEYIEKYLRGQTMEYAHEIGGGGTFTVDIREKGGVNYYVITVSAGEAWNVSTPTGMGYHKIWIYDASGKEITSYYSTVANPSNDIDYDYTFVRAGTYYIAVGYKSAKHDPGTFEVTFTKE